MGGYLVKGDQRFKDKKIIEKGQFSLFFEIKYNTGNGCKIIFWNLNIIFLLFK